jgi:hypothetical protein
MSAHATRVHQEIIFALVVGIPLAVFLMWRGGEGVVPALAAIATAFFAGFVVPRLPGSPNACLLQHPQRWQNCTGHYNAIYVLNLGVPLGVALICTWDRDRRRRGGAS